jgi:HlyD family secretion protein
MPADPRRPNNWLSHLGQRRIVTMGLMSNEPMTALRTAVPVVDETAPAPPREAPPAPPQDVTQGARRRGRPLLRAGLIALLALLVAGGIGAWQRFSRPPAAATAVLVYGTIDIRQSQLAFNDSDRIRRILVQEGDRVKKGELLAELDTARLQADVDKAAADVDAAAASIDDLKQAIEEQHLVAAEAQAAVDAEQAALTFSEQQNARYSQLERTGAGTVQEAQQWRSDIRQKQAALARDNVAVAVARKHVDVLAADLAKAKATLADQQAALAFAREQLADARLYAPADGVIEDRILEPGDMASPDRPALTLDLANPVYARAYLPERELGRVRPGMRASIETDAFPGKRFPAWIGFIATTAEFTPKTVETTEIRTELVYRMHVYACSTDGRLRLGAPVTVEIPLEDNGPAPRGEKPCG